MKVKFSIKPESKYVELIKVILKDCDDYDRSQSANKSYDGILAEKTGEMIKIILPELYKKYFS